MYSKSKISNRLTILRNILLLVILFLIIIGMQHFTYIYKKSEIEQKINNHLLNTSILFSNIYQNDSLFNYDNKKQLNSHIQYIDSVLNIVFKVESLRIDFCYAIIDHKTSNIVYSSNAKYNNELENSKMQAKLFQFGRNINSNIYLHCYVNDMQLIVIKSIRSVIIFSLIVFVFFTIILLFKIKRWIKDKNDYLLKDDFFYNITHELKTPLSTISLVSEIFVKKNYELPIEKIQNYIKIIIVENLKMRNLVDKLLNISIIEKSDLRLSIEKIDLHELLEKQLNDYNFLLKNKDIETLIKLEAKNSIINGDISYINIIISNIIDNAIKYSAENPKIEIITKSDDLGITLFIKDNGIGISRDSTEKVFKKYYRAENGKSIKGHGLGLFFVKQLVLLHKGTITIKSEISRGSTFEIYFPF